MRPYLAVLSALFRSLLQYRAAAFAGLVTQVFWGFIRVMVFTAFYHSTSIAQPMSLPEVITYIWLGQAFLRLQPWGVDEGVQAMVRSGNVAYELLRPVDLYGFWYARCVARTVAPTLLRALPMLVMAGLFFGLGAPASPAAALAFTGSVLAAVLLSAAVVALSTISLLWTIAGEGVARLMGALGYLLSGIVVPLPLLPPWAQRFLEAQPFRGLADVPFRLYTGHLPPAAALPLIGQQLLWSLAFILLGRLLLERGKRRLVVQGG